MVKIKFIFLLQNIVKLINNLIKEQLKFLKNISVNILSFIRKKGKKQLTTK